MIVQNTDSDFSDVILFYSFVYSVCSCKSHVFIVFFFLPKAPKEDMDLEHSPFLRGLTEWDKENDFPIAL